MKKIPLTRGQFALVDDSDFEWLSQYKWSALLKHPKIGYWIATTTIKNKKISMHRLIMNASKDKEIDHKNHNGVDNRRQNLRICTHAENQQNKNSVRGTSRFKGVVWHKLVRKWMSHIGFNCKTIHLGYFNNEIDAALAYDKAAKELFGEFAYTNF